MLSSLSTYKAVNRNLPSSLDRIAKDPFIARETAYYLKTIGSVKSSKEFVADDRLLRYAATAFGLSDVMTAKAFLKRVLDGGVDAQGALANRLSDVRYRDFASTFNFQRYGSATTAFDRTQQGTVDLYVRRALETKQGEGDNTVRLALYFARKAPELTSTLGLLADKALFEVARTALALPITIVNNDLDRQVALIEKRLNVADLKDPARLEKFVTRYFALAASANNTHVSTQLGGPTSVSSRILSQLQSFKLGGR